MLKLTMKYFTRNLNLLNGKSKVLIFDMLLVIVYSKRIFWGLLIHLQTKFFFCHSCKGIKYLTRLCCGLSYLNEDKFKQSFQDTLNPFCLCGLNVETNTHFFLYSSLFSIQRCILLSTVKLLIVLWQTLMIPYCLIFFFLVKVLLIYLQIHYIILTNRLEESLFYFVFFCYTSIPLTLFCVLMSYFLDYTVHLY